MSNTQRTRSTRRPAKAAPPAPAATPSAEEQPPGRARGPRGDLMAAHTSRMFAEQTQELAAMHALVDELEAENAQLREAVTGLQAELVAATSGEADTTG